MLLISLVGGDVMTDFYIEKRKCKNIEPVIFTNKEKYYFDLMNIEQSWSGRMDTNVCNTFIMEAEQQLVNAIELFEMGYFDCAYFSLRSAVDVSTTMVFLTDMPYEERDRSLMAWKDTKEFPMQREIIKQLSRAGNIFADMLRKMPMFFSEAKALSGELNKYVHKQGFQHFYVSRNHPINKHLNLDNFLKDFEKYLQRCIGVVAVMRLAIDPFPILLMDEDVLYRCFDSMTEPYSEEFVEKYIGEATIEQYKQTELYIGMYSSFIAEEKKKESVFNVMKHQYIDSNKLEEIFEQLHLLSLTDIVCVLLTATSEKIVKVYCYNGILMYFTDRNTNRTTWSWSSEDFDRFIEATEQVNLSYDEAYISVFNFLGEKYFVEHNEMFDVSEVRKIIDFVNESLAKISKKTEE